MRRLLTAVVVLGTFATASPVRGGDALVLVASVQSPVTTLDSQAVRKAFVGVPVWVAGNPVRALLNESEPELRPVFLQHVVGTSEFAYQRRVLRLTIQQGRPAPPVFHSADRLLEQLRRNPYAITYMWQRSAQRTPDIRIIRVLWHE
ncbi:MAG: hypothetical protein U1F30_07360 [Steroidobacteraceae bacterium]